MYFKSSGKSETDCLARSGTNYKSRYLGGRRYREGAQHAFGHLDKTEFWTKGTLKYSTGKVRSKK